MAGPEPSSPATAKRSNKEKKKEDKKKPSIKTNELYVRLRQLHDAHHIDDSKLEIVQRIGEGGFASGMSELCVTCLQILRIQCRKKLP